MVGSSSPVSFDSLSEEKRGRLRGLSKAVFGNRDRLEVAVAIARSDGFVNATDLCRELDLAQSRIRNQLVALADVGLLVSASLGADERKRWYGRKTSPFWELCNVLYEEWGA